MNIAWLDWYPRLPLWLQIVWPIWVIIGVILTSISAVVLAQQVPSGAIESPAPGSTVRSPIVVTGTISNLQNGHSLWLAVKKGDRIWPKQPPFEASAGKWSTTLVEESTSKGVSFSVALVAATPPATVFLHQWFKGGPTGTHFPGILAETKGLTVLAESQLILN